MNSKEMSEDYVYELPIKVRDYEVDAEGIVNNGCMPVFESPRAAPLCVGTLYSPSYQPVVEAAPAPSVRCSTARSTSTPRP